VCGAKKKGRIEIETNTNSQPNRKTKTKQQQGSGKHGNCEATKIKVSGPPRQSASKSKGQRGSVVELEKWGALKNRERQ